MRRKVIGFMRALKCPLTVIKQLVLYSILTNDCHITAFLRNIPTILAQLVTDFFILLKFNFYLF